MTGNDFHTPVLVEEAISFLDVLAGEKYIDATIGGGGHSLEISKRGGIVLGIDIDQEAIDYVKARIKNLTLACGNFKNIGEIARSNGFSKVKGILFDLGVSSHELNALGRGFSFQRDEPLDMRMNQKEQKVTAADLVNGLTKKELYELFNKLAEEKYSWAISESIIRAREVKPIKTTKELADLVSHVYKRHNMRKTKINPATKVFQALRIAVNDELNNLREALPQAVDLLTSGGRLVVVSFHSIEDRIIKDFGKENLELNIVTKKPVVPAIAEINANPRSRSAKLRAYEKR